MINFKTIRNPFEPVDIEKMLDEAETELDDPNTKFISHEEIMEHARRIINGRI